MTDWFDFLQKEGVSQNLIDEAKAFRERSAVDSSVIKRVSDPQFIYYGKETWEKALASILAGENLLLAGPKATGKNVLAENLAAVFGRPLWDVSFHINVDASYLVGTDTYDGQKVVFRKGPVYNCAVYGGFGVLDEINMARNEALAVLHATLDFRRILDIPGYDRIEMAPETRFIATMNYGYAGTRDLNEALCSRFAVLDMPVITEDDLGRLLERSFPSMKKAFREQFVRLFLEIEKKAENAEISERALDLRGLLDAIALMQKGILSGPALSMCITNKTFDAYERKLVQDVIDARIPEDLDKKVIFG